MVITKTKFMNLMRCPRYAALAFAKDDFKKSEITYEDYILEEADLKRQELMATFSELELLEDEVNEQLEVMLPYYNEIEILAAREVQNIFGGETRSSKITFEQQSFDYVEGVARFLCYVDVYNKVGDAINIVEVKATTSRKFYELGIKSQKTGVTSIWEKDIKGIYNLKTKLDEPLTEKKFNEKMMKLYDRYDDCGRYVYDLAIQRYILENDYKRTNRTSLIKNVNYYLAVLNHE